MLHSHINFTPSLQCILLCIYSTNFHRYRTLKILWICSILWYQMLGIKLVDVLTRMYCFCYYYENTPYNLIHSHPVLQATCEIICEAHVALKGIRSYPTGITTLKSNKIQSLDNLEVCWARTPSRWSTPQVFHNASFCIYDASLFHNHPNSYFLRCLHSWSYQCQLEWWRFHYGYSQYPLIPCCYSMLFILSTEGC